MPITHKKNFIIRLNFNKLSSESYRYQDIFYKISKALLSKQKMFIGGVFSTVCFILKPFFGFVQGRLI
jgi:hypothetical protein